MPTVDANACPEGYTARAICGLQAEGESLNGWKFKAVSKLMYETRADAEKFIPDFIKRCCDETQFECCTSDTIKVSVYESVLMIQK